MKRLFLLSALLLTVSAVGASAYSWTDNFDSYADQAAFNASWTGTAQMTLDTDGTPAPPSAPNSIAQGTGAQQSYKLVPALQGSLVDFSFSFYDETGTGSLARTYGMLYSRAGNLWTDGLQQILAIGKYNGIASTKYHARVAFGSSNWFVLANGPDRSVGWHTAQVKANIGAGTWDFYIDNILSGTAPMPLSNNTYNFQYVVMGSGLTSTHGMNFDNVSLVPEPGSLLALGAGLTSMAGLIRRRR